MSQGSVGIHSANYSSSLVGYIDPRKIQSEYDYLYGLDYHIDFGFISANETHEKSFKVYNRSRTVPLNFAFQSTRFEVVPKEGTINAKGKKVIKIKVLSPKAACLDEQVHFKINDEEPIFISIKATTKYPYLCLSEKQVDFGTVSNGGSLTRKLEVMNMTQVDSAYSIQPAEHYIHSCFELSHSKGRIKANSKEDIEITYQPYINGAVDNQLFNISSIAGNGMQFEVKGRAEALKVTCSSPQIYFGEVETKNYVTKVLFLENMSVVDAKFQFLNDSKTNVFKVLNPIGKIPANTTRKVTIVFHPVEIGHYYEKIYYMVHDSNVRSVETLGSCYEQLFRPPKVDFNHSEAYIYRILKDTLFKSNVDKLEERQEFNEAKKNYPQILNNVEDEVVALQGTEVSNYQLAFKSNATGRLLSVHPVEELNFGFGQPGKVTVTKAVVFRNDSPKFIYVSWLHPGINCPVEEGYKHSYKISPMALLIKPSSTAEFLITFDPDDICKVYSHLLYYRYRFTNYNFITNKMFSEDDFITVSDRVSVSGHSFPKGYEIFIPLLEIYPGKDLTFKPCRTNETTYQSVVLSNSGDTPIHYEFVDLPEIIDVTPKTGFVPSKGFGIVLFSFHPKIERYYEDRIKCRLNMKDVNTIFFDIKGLCEKSILFLENEGKVFYPQTSVNASTPKSFFIRNQSGLELQYRLLPDQNSNYLQIDGDVEGIILPNDTANISTKFMPKEEGRFKFQLGLLYFGLSSYHHKLLNYNVAGSLNKVLKLNQPQYGDRVIVDKKNSIIKCEGVAGYGTLEVNPTSINFSHVQVGMSKKFDVELYNNSDFSLQAFLKLDYTGDAGQLTKVELDKQLSYFKLSMDKCHVKSRIRRVFNLEFCPGTDCKVDLTLKVYVGDEGSSQLEIAAACAITAIGEYPKLEVLDLRNSRIPTSILWDSFEINRFNREMLHPLDTLERRFCAIYGIKDTKDLMANLAKYSWDFGRIPFGSDESLRVVLTLQNVGGTLAELTVKFPDETGEIESGVDNTQRSYTKKIKANIHKQLFDVKPRKVKIQPGTKTDLEIFYNPREVGFHELTLVAMLTNGKPFQIELKGETIDRSAGILSPLIRDVCLYPTPINLQYPVTNQIYFKNSGTTKVRWAIDRTQVEILGDGQRLLDDIGILEESGETGPEEIDFVTILYKPHLKTIMNISIPLTTEDENGFREYVLLKARCLTYNPNVDTLATLQASTDAVVVKHIPNSQVPITRKSTSQLLTAAILSCEEICFKDLKPNETKFGLSYLNNVSKRFKFNYYVHLDGLLNASDYLQVSPQYGTVQPGSAAPLKVSLFSLPANVFSYLNLNVPVYVEWIDCNDSTNTVKFRERIFFRIYKEAQLLNTNVKKQIAYHSPDILSTTLMQLVDDLFYEGFVDKCVERLEQHPETLYMDMDDEEVVTLDNVQTTLYPESQLQLQLYDPSLMSKEADKSGLERQDSMKKFNKRVRSKENLHEEKLRDLEQDKYQHDEMRESRMSFTSILRDEKRTVSDNFMLDQEVQNVCLNVYESVLFDLFSDLVKN